MNPDWVAIAVLGKPRGNRGEVTAISLSSHPERFSALAMVYLFGNPSPSGERFAVERVWDHDGTLIFKFEGVDSIEEAGKLRGAEVRIPASERAKPDRDEFFHSDLIGCEVQDRKTHRRLGMVTAVEEYGGPALLEIDGGRILIPFVRTICTEILVADRLVRVDLPEGLENLDRPE